MKALRATNACEKSIIHTKSVFAMVPEKPLPFGASVILNRAEIDLLEWPARRVLGFLVLRILNDPAEVWTVAYELERRRVVFENLPE